MATQIKATKKNSPSVQVGKNSNNKPAEAYAKNGTGVAAEYSAVCYATDPNTMKADEITPGMPAMSVSIGNKTRAAKSTGIESRGNGAATKGRIARGPMA